ncbi:MAG: hypothetical protein IT207_09800 [Fimbriimonadaceae bacterium]|nr:hypothetical protein [Fimbriimonadaceae bacterium]
MELPKNMRTWLPIVILLLAQGPRAACASGWMGHLHGSASYRCQRLAIAVAVAREHIALSSTLAPPVSVAVADDSRIGFEVSARAHTEPATDGVRARDGPRRS